MAADAGPIVAFDLKIRGATLIYDGDATIGKGSRSSVLKGRFVKDGSSTPVAIKYTRTDSKKAAEEMKKNVRELKNVKNPYLIRYYDGTVIDEGNKGTNFALITVMELMECSLLDLFFSDVEFAEKVKFRDFINIFMSVAKGVERIHCERAVHYHLKTASILASKTGPGVKIGDYADSKFICPERFSVSTLSIPDGKYVAPEISCSYGIQSSGKQEVKLGAKEESDIYSLGCVMWECLNFCRLGTQPGEPHLSGREVYFEGIRGATVVHCNGPEPLCELIQDCIRFSRQGIENRSHNRPTAGKIVERLEKMLKEKWIDFNIKTYEKDMEKCKVKCYFNFVKLKYQKAAAKFQRKLKTKANLSLEVREVKSADDCIIK